MTLQQEAKRSGSFYPPAVIGFSLVIGSLAAAIVAPMGSRIGWWNYDFAVQILKGSATIGALASILCLVGIVGARPGRGRRGRYLSLVALIVMVPALGLLAYWHNAKKTLPPIQDITTDMANPPEFWYAPNARVYGGPAIAELQRRAYPDIQPLFLSRPTEQVFELALAVLRETGWTLVATEPEDGRIEATESTFWFGFSDDIVVRITVIEDGSRIDVRSTSRFGGGGDGGTNAKRVRRVLRALEKRSSG